MLSRNANFPFSKYFQVLISLKRFGIKTSNILETAKILLNLGICSKIRFNCVAEIFKGFFFFTFFIIWPKNRLPNCNQANVVGLIGAILDLEAIKLIVMLLDLLKHLQQITAPHVFKLASLKPCNSIFNCSSFLSALWYLNFFNFASTCKEKHCPNLSLIYKFVDP